MGETVNSYQFLQVGGWDGTGGMGMGKEFREFPWLREFPVLY